MVESPTRASSVSTFHFKVHRLNFTVVTSERQAQSISSQAADNLTFIRAAMERSSTFTAVPGIGGVIMGGVALLAASVSARHTTPDKWLLTWLVAAPVAVMIELVAMGRKAHRAGLTLTGATGRRFALGMIAPLVAGAAITYELWRARNFSVMVPTWLLLYGAGLVTGGMFSVAVIRIMGMCFMAAGIASMVTPAGWGNTWLAIGFGGLHVVFGAYIARYHGG